MMTKEQARDLIGKALSYSRFPECEVSIRETEQAQVRFANNGVTTAGFTVERVVSVSSTREGKTGEAETSGTDDASLQAAIARSEEMAAISPANAERMPPLGPQEFPAIQAWDEDTAVARGPVMVPHASAAIDRAMKDGLVAAGFFQRSAQVDARGNKQELFGYHRSTNASLSTTVRRADGSSSGWAGQPSPRIREINGALLAETAVQKCLAWRNPRRLEPGRYTVLLEPTAVSDLLNGITPGLMARSADEGRSFLSKKGGGTVLGEKLFPESITLGTDPFDRRMHGLPWLESGVPNRKVTWIDKGVVANLSYDRYWASKSGKRVTPAPTPLVMSGGGASREELIRSVEKGLLVTRFFYIRFVNQQTLQHTGLTRDGLFLIENGKIAAPVMNLRFNESPVRMLQNTVKLGVSVRCGGAEGGMVAPALVVRDFAFTSISDAV